MATCNNFFSFKNLTLIKSLSCKLILSSSSYISSRSVLHSFFSIKLRAKLILEFEKINAKFSSLGCSYYCCCLL